MDIFVTKALQHQDPLFVHIDEIGGLAEKDLRALRDSVQSTWLRINMLARRGRPTPTIYFYFSGKGIPLLSLGGATSPVGTKWIILDTLKVKHIHDTRMEMLKVNKEAGSHLDEILHRWTGGAPRLLVYTLRYLHHANPPLSTDEEATAAMEAAYEVFKNIRVVANDVWIRHADVSLQEIPFLCFVVLFLFTYLCFLLCRSLGCPWWSWHNCV